MPVKPFQKTQYEFTAHLRDPLANAAPIDIEDRRIKIYRDLIYNNIESFLSTGFPILRDILADKHWHEIVRDFVSQHQSHTPYFLEISQEFLKYLQDERVEHAADPAFMLELAHYEWVELAMDVLSKELPENIRVVSNVLETVAEVSPLAWKLSYQYPVHRIGEAYQPTTPPPEPTFLVVYRNRDQQVKFLEANAVTIQLLQLFESQVMTGRDALEQIARDLQYDDSTSVISSGEMLLSKLYALDILI